jgi:hypothetical protein
MRLPGIVLRRLSISSSDHVAPITSPERGGQDRKFQRPRSNVLLLAPLGQDHGELGIGQRGMMLDRRTFGRFGNRLSRWPCQRPTHGCDSRALSPPIEYAFDPTSDRARGFGLLGLDPLQRLHDQPDIDGLHRQGPEDWVDIGTEGAGHWLACLVSRHPARCAAM